MARNWTKEIPAAGFRYVSAQAAPDQVPTTLRDCASFSASADQYVDIQFSVPAEHTGTGTLKMDIFACANTATATDDARLDAATEFKTPGAGEARNSFNVDATPDSGTMTFSTTTYSLQKLTITLTPAVAAVAGDLGMVRLTRDGDNAGGLDDLAVPLLVEAVEVYEEV